MGWQSGQQFSIVELNSEACYVKPIVEKIKALNKKLNRNLYLVKQS